MKYILPLMLIATTAIAKIKLQTGDILLQPLNCWVCGLIEEEENTIYSHMGITIVENQSIKILEAWGSVQESSLSDFLSKTQQGERIKVIRPKKSNLQNENSLNEITDELRRNFEEDFQGKNYDRDFLWTNLDSNGQEKFYCAEFVAKFLNTYLINKVLPKKMHFKKNRNYWRRYFQGSIPDNQLGLSPADFERSNLFEVIGELTP